MVVQTCALPISRRWRATYETTSMRLQSLVRRGSELREAGRYHDAEPILRQALTLAEQDFGPNSLETARVLNELGVLGKYDGHFDSAAAEYNRALNIVALTTGANNEFAATLFHNLGGLEHARGRFAAGEPFARRSVEIREGLLGPDHPDTAADVAALAALLDGQHKYEE